jgi:hypothetical protein
MHLRVSSVVVLGTLSLVSCFEPPPPRRSAIGPSSSYRGSYGDAYGEPGPHHDPYDAPPPLDMPRDPAPPLDPVRPPAAPSPAARKEYPVAERTNNPNQVLSPYEPYNVIDVAGFKSGQLAKDPSNGKIFRVP